MATYLLLCNPADEPWPEMAETVEKVKRREELEETWRVRSSRKYIAGDRLYILKVGRGQKGIMGSGIFTRRRGRKIIALRYDALLNPDNEEVLPRSILTKYVRGVLWSPRASGTSLPAKAASKVESLWRRHLGRDGANFALFTDAATLPEEIGDDLLGPAADKRLPAGSVRRITVNAYERNSGAREKCVEYYKARCSACGLDFGERFGKDFAGLIHVHHVTPLSKVGIRYKVNPIKDLLPVCPNCHAMLHWGGQTRTVAWLRKLIQESC
jgi:5-methylcytosine-specific restriction protein A